MLEAIAQIIPPYQRIYNICKHNGSETHGLAEDYHLATLLSYMYADLVRLFLELYQIFCRGAPGAEVQSLMFGKTKSALWRPLDSRFAHIETRIGQHRKWLEKEAENQLQYYLGVSKHRRNYLSFLHRPNGVNCNSQVEQEGQRLAKRLRRVEKVQIWLSNSTSVGTTAYDFHQPYQDSCVWFLRAPAYTKWRDQHFDQSMANDQDVLAGNWQHRVLFVQAKAGFGKTVISQSVVSNLAGEVGDTDLCDEPPATAYYHFSNLLSKDDQPEDAFRTLSRQLLQTHRYDRSTLDAVSLLLRKTSFREHATTDEVMDVLLLLLRQHPTFIVVDGVDECSDTEMLLTSLAKLCRGSDTRVIVFSRPNLSIPLEYQKWASGAPHIFPLTREHNAVAINRFVAPELNRLADQGFFGISMDRSLISEVAKAADGDFLWAGMALKFLQSRLLSSEERVAVLQGMNSLHGLESLFRIMFDVLARHPPAEKRIITDTFRWLSFPINCMYPGALHAALNSCNSKVFESSHMDDIIEALPELTYGIFRHFNDDITFSHGSIRDHLRSPLLQSSEFSLCDESSVHAHLAARCLAYLAHDVPKRPLGALQPNSPAMPLTIPTSSSASQRTSASGDSGYKSLSSSDGDTNTHATQVMPTQHNSSRANMVRTIPFDTHLPFLRYAALCWPIHLSRALTPSSHHTTSSADTLAYLPVLGVFLASRLAVTTWVEASFRYSLPPTLTRLVGPLSNLKSELSPATVEGKELRLVVNMIRGLSEKLVDLKRKHEGVMRQNPSLIWQMNGPCGDAYWPVWERIVAGVNEW
ncbi:hypothetical protein G6011_08793 [Alternaria panax]|uniref:Nephrocystin 3-like N-terminal domain-containing protein n=1 Tax=Alternaria panax TaxID=48097 RepID=A0AAD4FIR2_9PLEO|nr:hypothetical protein G6011_08793 [Alternaria panax]